LLFWEIGRTINTAVLQEKLACYGGQVVVTLARQLAEKCGNPVPFSSPIFVSFVAGERNSHSIALFASPTARDKCREMLYLQ
jgi:hypothetical protein